MKLTRREIETVLRALEGAERDSLDLIACHTKHGKSIDRKVTEREKAFLKRLRALRAKLFSVLHPGKTLADPFDGLREVPLAELMRDLEGHSE